LGPEFPGRGEEAGMLEIGCFEALPDDRLGKEVKDVVRHSANVVVMRSVTGKIIFQHV
jgi:hypothetical protein